VSTNQISAHAIARFWDRMATQPKPSAWWPMHPEVGAEIDARMSPYHRRRFAAGHTVRVRVGKTLLRVRLEPVTAAPAVLKNAGQYLSDRDTKATPA